MSNKIQKLFFTFLLLITFAESSFSKSNDLPSWFIKPRANNIDMIYGVAEGFTLEEATFLPFLWKLKKKKPKKLTNQKIILFSVLKLSKTEKSSVTQNKDYEKNYFHRIIFLNSILFKLYNSRS